MKRICALTCLLALLPLAGTSQSILGGSMTSRVEGFTTQGHTPDGKTFWHLSGRWADLSETVTEIRQYTLKVIPEGGQAYMVTSHHCRYLRVLNEVRSKAPIHLTSDGLKASGIGYDLFLDTQIIHIRSNVKIDAKRSKLPREVPLPDGENDAKANKGNK